VKVHKLSVFLLAVIAMFGVIPCVYAQNDDPCARYSDINVQTMCRNMLFGSKGEEGLNAFRDGFVNKYSIPAEELTSGVSIPPASVDRSQIMKYAFPSAPSAESKTDDQVAPSADSEKNDQEKEQPQPQKSDADKSYDRHNIFR